MSDSSIADHIGVSSAFVGKMRDELAPTINGLESTTRIGKDGRTINTENIGKRAAAEEEATAVAEIDDEESEDADDKEANPLKIFFQNA